MSFDEIHKLLVEYYDVMEITPDAKKKRVDCAFGFYEAVWFVLMMINLEYNHKQLAQMEEYIKSLVLRLEDYLNENNLPYDEKYLKKMATDVVETTFRHLDESEIEEEEDNEEINRDTKNKISEEEKKPNYWLSEDRAVMIAENESNTVWNTIDFNEAKAGGKLYKTWITEGDDKVRFNHFMVDGMKIPIGQPFPVGEDMMYFPHDYMNGSAENLINCRCTILYS